MPVIGITANRDVKDSTHMNVAVGNGMSLAFFDFPHAARLQRRAPEGGGQRDAHRHAHPEESIPRGQGPPGCQPRKVSGGRRFPIRQRPQRLGYRVDASRVVGRGSGLNPPNPLCDRGNAGPSVIPAKAGIHAHWFRHDADIPLTPLQNEEGGSPVYFSRPCRSNILASSAMPSVTISTDGWPKHNRSELLPCPSGENMVPL